MICNLAVDLDARSREVPERMGLAFEDGRQWTYAEWNDEAVNYAGALRSAGVVEGARVALFCQNSPELTFLLFGCWRLGAVPVAVSSMYGLSELQGCLDKTGPMLVVTDESRFALASGAHEHVRVVGSEHAAALDMVGTGDDIGSERPGLVDVPPDDDAAILFTGGTTGEPKAVTVAAGGVRTALATLARASKGGRDGPYRAAPESVSPNLLAWPLFHSGGQQALLFALHVGRAIVLLERFRPTSVAEAVAEYEIDNLFLLPTMVYDLQHSDPPVRLDSVRSVLIAGQAIDPTLKREFEQNFGVPILSNYGSTEMGHVAGWTAKDIRVGRWIPGSAGRVYDGVDVEVRDDGNVPLAPGADGVLWVRSTLTNGYVEGDCVDELVVDGWVNSGDVGHLDTDGVLYLVGRARDMIKTSGFQVWPAEIERVLREHHFVADVAVIGVPDERRGEIPKAFVVPTSKAPELSVAAPELIEFCRDRLAHFKQIRSVEFLDALPRSDAGKVQRAALVNEQEPTATEPNQPMPEEAS